MMQDRVYLCRRCFVAQAGPGNCPRCGLELVSCRPGDPDDLCRRPLMDAQGRIRTRAPLWWLHFSVGELVERVLRE